MLNRRCFFLQIYMIPRLAGKLSVEIVSLGIVFELNFDRFEQTLCDVMYAYILKLLIRLCVSMCVYLCACMPYNKTYIYIYARGHDFQTDILFSHAIHICQIFVDDFSCTFIHYCVFSIFLMILFHHFGQILSKIYQLTFSFMSYALHLRLFVCLFVFLFLY